MRRLLSAILLALAMAQPARAPAAPAAGLADRLRALAGADLRVAAIGHRLATAAVPLCDARVGDPGMVVATASQYNASARPTASALFHLEDGPAVVAVVPGAAAERAGVRAGDRLLGINGQGLEDAEPAGSRASGGGYSRLVDAIAAGFANGPATLDVERAGRPLSLRFAGDPACATIFQMILDDKLNAAADGRIVSVTYRLALYAGSDDELAFVIGHEFAHNLLGHRRRLDAEGVPRGLLGSLGAGAGRIRATEMEADYYGVYLMARAGYDPHAAAAFWRKMRKARGLLWVSGASHLGDSARIDFLERAAAEVDAQRTRGAPLIPDYPRFSGGGA